MRLPQVQADELLAAAFGDYVSQWALQQGADPAACAFARRAAAKVSKATSAGHVCLRLLDVDEIPQEAASHSAALRVLLLASHVVGTPDAPRALPLILDANDRLYLHRYFDYENRLARCLVRRRRSPAGLELPSAPVLTQLNAVFGEKRQPPHINWQKVAVLTALLGNLTIISGGPGTGKTTAIVSLLACLITQNPAQRIMLAAPTGKAAARILETLRQRKMQLPASIARQLPTESFTIHRLLGAGADGFRHNAANLLPVDVLIIDEASMLDLALATQLFEAMPPAARIILVGDKDQLAAVESGAVFAELSAHASFSRRRAQLLAEICDLDAAALLSQPPAPVAALQDAVVWLRQNYRFAADSAIGRLAADINGGDATAALERLLITPTKRAAVAWIAEGSYSPSAAAQDEIYRGYAAYVAALQAGSDPLQTLQAFDQYRILCALHSGARGADALNELVAKRLRRALQHPLDPGRNFEWYPGRPVIVLRNDYALQLSNGDIGITLPNAAGQLMVYFAAERKRDAAADMRAVAPVRLPEHGTAFAMTIHKAQGSEFDEVLLALPAAISPILTRELLYTGVTRARTRVNVMAPADVLTHTINTPTQRLSGLMARYARTLHEMPSSP